MAQVTTRNRNKNTDKKPNWEYRFEAARINGKRKHISKSGFRTQKEALAAGTKALAEYNSGGQTFQPAEISFSDYLDLWLEKYVMVNLRPKTQESYKGIINNHIRPALGQFKLNALNPSALQDFANSLKTKGYSKRHIVNIMSTITNSLNYAIEPLQYIKHNPAKLIKLPKVERAPRQRIVLSPEDWEQIISRFPFGNKYHIPLMIGYYTGMRISEVFALTWEDIDFEKLEIKVSKQIVKIKPDREKAKWCFGEPKTKSAHRIVRIGSNLSETLKREKLRQKENKLLYGHYRTKYSLCEMDELVPDENGKIDLLCVNDDGTFVTTDSFKYCSRVIHHELKIDFDFHSLRHTHATILIENGISPKSVQKRLGHEKIETTLQTYVHETPEMAEEAAEAFDRATGGQKYFGGHMVDKSLFTPKKVR